MSNILIIKHGAFGDIIQALGTIQDIAYHHNGMVDVLTHRAYAPLFKKLPYVNHIILDDRKATTYRHFKKLYQTLKHQNYKAVYDLQNSTRTTLYRWLFLRHVPFISNRSMLHYNETKKCLDKKNIFYSFELMLKRAGIESIACKKPNVTYLKDQSFKAHKDYQPYIFVAPFCSANNPQKKWPHFKNLITQLKTDFPDLTFVCAPGPGEIEEANVYEITSLLYQKGPTTLEQLVSIILDAQYVITLDTAAAHIAARSDKPGTLIMDADRFGRLFLEGQKLTLACHQTQLKDLSLEKVYTKIKADIDHQRILKTEA
ncbi:MAG: glycosyltransferase family 9 protein [Gammaproteobacteria bacterium]|nr:glycosyltransferase family 9 protein [Gammaproteobacteria bacterium]